MTLNIRALMGSTAGPTPPDPYFANVVMLLHGDGSNGAQNSTFVDGSTNAYSITRSGNSPQGSFSAFGTNWSNYINGGYISLTNNTGLGSNNFTIEFWARDITGTSNWGFFSIGATSGVDYAGITMHSSGGLFISTTGSSWQYSNIGGLTFSTDGLWHHYAIVRNGGSLLTFKDGVLIQTNSISGSLTNNSGHCRIGSKSDASGSTYGHVSNFRVVNGSALYTSNFTPSTTPLTAVTNTVLLTCQSNRFRDASTNNFTITRNGDVSVTNFGPFIPATEYSSTTIGGSAYFDGAGDYLTVGNGLHLGTSDFTVEMWVYPLVDYADGTEFAFLSQETPAASGNTWGVGLYSYGGFNGLTFAYGRYGYFIVGKYVNNFWLSKNQWTHIVFQRRSGTIECYINGVSQSLSTYNEGATFSDGADLTSSLTTKRIASDSFDRYFTGYMSGVRIVSGSAVYSGNFTPSTTPPTAVANTKLLANFTNAAIFDSSAKNVIETVGNAQISTSVKKFGTGSIYLDGSGDYLTLPPNSDSVLLGTGSFTIEFWINPNSSQPSTRTSILSFGNGFTTNVWAVQLNNTSPSYVNRIQLWAYNLNSGAVVAASTGTISASTWTHVAVVRNGSNFTIYINGVADGTGSSSASMDSGSTTLQLQVGYNSPDYYAGYIDDLRITKGVARYTTNFTPPSRAFSDK